MDLRKLTIFREVAKQNSFRRAAESLHIAQPAISIAIQKLESELKTLLFNRSGRQIQITKEGIDVLEHTEGILNAVQALEDSVHQSNQLLKGDLEISCPSMLATYYLPDILNRFLVDYPGVNASIAQTGTQQAQQQLLNREIELGVITLDRTTNKDRLEIAPLIKEALFLCVHSNHPWSSRSSIHIQDLQSQPLMLYEKGYFIRSAIDSLCLKYHVKPEIRMQTNFLPLIMNAVKQELGAAVGLSKLADQDSELVTIPIKPKTELNLAFAKLKGNSISRPNQVFFDWVKAL